ncbi:MAG TPA: DUF885 family protein [Bacteroidota bacterium]|nr:DUF885 family protein [Bacteroidota bacterium]
MRNIVGLALCVSMLSSATLTGQQKSSYDRLVELFKSWREFQTPQLVDGVPDYSSAAMGRQHRELPAWQKRLKAIDTTGWSISQQVDWYLVWAEMNGLDFKHRVKKPWSRDPAFYVWFYPEPTDVPEREGPNIAGAIELPRYSWPLKAEDAKEIAEKLRKAEKVFQQARVNLIGNARDLWISGIRSIRAQSADLEEFAKSVENAYPDLGAAAREARQASDRFADWLSERAKTKTGLSGVGKENYTWNLRHVQLVPYSWDDAVLLLRRELSRAHAALRLEENRNRHLPKLSKINSAEEYDRRLNEAVTEYMEFLRNEEILTIKDYMDPALRERIGRFTPAEGLRGFFAEITYREPIMMRTHDYHWIDLARMREEPHPSPIRRVPLLFNIFDSRAEGMATGMEEMMTHAGLLDKKPRSRELVWILLAQRAARGLGGLYQHGLEMTLDQAAQFASKWTPWGLLPADGETIQWEEHFYLRQPGYGISYVVGKIMIEQLIAEYARQREGSFVFKEFMDRFNQSGMIPLSLIYWEMTGDKSMLEAAVKGK